MLCLKYSQSIKQKWDTMEEHVYSPVYETSDSPDVTGLIYPTFSIFSQKKYRYSTLGDKYAKP